MSGFGLITHDQVEFISLLTSVRFHLHATTYQKPRTGMYDHPGMRLCDVITAH